MSYDLLLEKKKSHLSRNLFFSVLFYKYPKVPENAMSTVHPASVGAANYDINLESETRFQNLQLHQNQLNETENGKVSVKPYYPAPVPVPS